MDNLTHSLAGIALAEAVLPASATPRERRVFMAGSVVAANLPDIDLAYTWITPPPLGYLLHHRGHTHTVAGLLFLALLMPVCLRLWPATRELTATRWARLWLLVVGNLVIHVAFDACNTYGVHPLYPFDSGWYYGDAVFIFEPLIWLLLGVAAACNAQRAATRVLISSLVSGLLLIVAVGRVVPIEAVVVTIVVASLFFVTVRNRRNRARTAGALGLTAAFIAGMFVLSHIAKTEARAAVTSGGEIVDVIVSPDPGMPVCWAAIVIARTGNGDGYRTSRGTISLAPGWFPPTSCASHRLAMEKESPSRMTGSVAWRSDLFGSVSLMRDLSHRDCWVRAWLQFGRAPVIRDNFIMDARFDTGVRGNFTAMPLAQAGCPSNLTDWAMPREDLFGLSR